MRVYRLTLVGEGPSDRALLPVLEWMVRPHLLHPFTVQWAEFPPGMRPASLVGRIDLGVQLYPCDLLFVHRDADRDSRANRVEEIHRAIAQSVRARSLPVVCVVPVRMTETWLLIDEEGIRRAAGNPNGQVAIDIPRPRDLEQLSNPKTLLRQLIQQASERRGRKLRSRDVSASLSRLAGLIDDFSALRQLAAFQAMEAEFLQLKNEQGW